MNKNQGFTLIEVLISIVILSIGLLGLAALQTKNLQYIQTANVRTQATFLAADLVDQINTNKTAAMAGQYNVTAMPTGTAGCTGTACLPSAMARSNLINWYQRINQRIGTNVVDLGLAPSVATISCSGGVSCPAGSLYTIRIFWVQRVSLEDDQANGTDDPTDGFETKTYITEFRL